MCYGNDRITIIGAGYVGLPTAALFANVGFSVTAVDIQPHLVEKINSGFSPINEPGLQEILLQSVKAKRLVGMLPSKVNLKNESAIIISVQTPIRHNKKPDLSFLMNAIMLVGENLTKNQLIVICSTIPPGTMKNKILPILESKSGLKADVDFFLAYVPERIAPGKALSELVENPRLVGGIGLNSTNKAHQLFSHICKNLILTDAITAEISKLSENTFRDINIAYANQLAVICEIYNADITKVIQLANTHPRVNIHNPGPGVGGPCLTKDPCLLIHELPLKNNIISLARAVNDDMPKHIVELTLKSFKIARKNVKKSRIVILGTAYKADVDDSRCSPSEVIIKELRMLGANLVSFDPFCSESFGTIKASSLEEAVQNADCLIIVTDHSEFKRINYVKIKQLMNNSPIIIDSKRIINSNDVMAIGFIYCGLGFGKIVAPTSEMLLGSFKDEFDFPIQKNSNIPIQKRR